MSKQDLTHLNPETHTDEIDLAELVRNLLTQWKLICGITFLGTTLGITTALLLPSEYRVEAIFDKPSTINIQPLLSQTIVPLTRQQVVDSYLKNLTSKQLIEQALENQGLLTNEQGETLTPAQKFSLVTSLIKSIHITPAIYDFIETTENSEAIFDQISFSILSRKPHETALWMNDILALASVKTTKDLSNDIIGQRNIEISKINNYLEQLKNTGMVNRQRNIDRLESALAIASELNITAPTSWTALVHGRDSVQLLNEHHEGEEYFLKGTRILTTMLSALKKSPIQLSDLMVTTVNDEGITETKTISSSTLLGQLSTFQNYSLDENNIQYISSNTKALAPVYAEKPNRKLIAIAATIISALLAFLFALIRLAIKRDQLD